MLEIAVVGVGSMGQNHCRVLTMTPGVRLAAIVDPDPVSGAAIADQYSVPHHLSLDALPDSIEAAIVSSPTPTHVETGVALLERGLDVLVEKPLADSVVDAERIAKAARAHDRVLMVGHIEKFNPVVAALLEYASDPIYVEARRISPFTGRVKDGVTTDLMIHDLDLVRTIVASDLVDVTATVRTLRGGTEDLSVAIMSFGNGVVANVVASRVGQDKVRQIVVTQNDCVIRADLVRQDLTIHRVQEVSFGRGTGYRESGVVEVPFLTRRGEPLQLEIEHFVQCVLDRSTPMTDAEDGIAAVRMVEQVLVAAKAGSIQVGR